jgi:hypothetical protein
LPSCLDGATENTRQYQRQEDELMPTPDNPWVQVNFRMRESLRAALEEAHNRNGRSLNSEITERLALSFVEINQADVLDAVSKTSDAIKALNKLANKAVDLSGEFTKELLRVQETLLAVTNKLLASSDQERGK